MTPDEILIEAARLVGGERSKKHGEYIALERLSRG
jgi:hypothetical protein